MGEDSIWIKKIRKVTQWLIISGALNVAFIFTLIALSLPKKESFHSVKLTLSPDTVSKENLSALSDYFSKPFDELICELENRQPIQDGYLKRDLALSYLVSFYDFDLQRALPGLFLQKRQLAFIHNGDGEQIEVQLYPGLYDHHFDAIRTFAMSEKWPLTPRGLFYELTHQKEPTDSLKEAFFFTKEFHLIETLFNHMASPMPRELLLQMLLQGGWEKLASFVKRHPLLDQINPIERRELLLDYAGCGSSVAARLLIELERDFTLHHLDDERLTSVLASIEELTYETESAFKEMLYSVRSDRVRTLAGFKLYALNKEVPPEPYDHLVALQRFLPEFFEPKVEFIAHRPHASRLRYHRIREGDTLWHISRTYQVRVEDLMRENDLKSAYLLTVGRELKIPD